MSFSSLIWLVCALFLVRNCVSTMTWSYTISPTKVQARKFLPITFNARQKLTTDRHVSELSTIGDSSSIVRDLLLRFTNSSMSATVGKLKYLQKNGLAVVSIPLVPFGYKNMHLKVTYRDINEDIGLVDGSGLDTGRFKLKWISAAHSSGLRLACIVSCTDSKVVIETEAHSVGLSKMDLRKVSEVVETALKSELERGMGLAAARREQIAAGQARARLAAKVEKTKALDKIIHPEKYLSKAATVRRSGSHTRSGGSGRYTPSAGTQARRQVKRGG